MRTRLIALTLFAASGLFAQVRVIVAPRYDYRVPAPVAMYTAPPVAYVNTYVPPCPGPDYSYVAGYWYPVGARYEWRAGYWARPAYANSYWVAPRYERGNYYHGYWGRRR